MMHKTYFAREKEKRECKMCDKEQQIEVGKATEKEYEREIARD